MNTNRLPRSNKFQLCAVALALLGGANAFAATSTAINPGAATDSSSGSGATGGSAGTGTFSFNQYSGGGVLTGASFSTTFADEGITFSSTSPNSASGYAYGVGGFSVTGVTGVTVVTGSATSGNTIEVTGVNKDVTKSGTIAAYTATANATSQAQLNIATYVMPH